MHLTVAGAYWPGFDPKILPEPDTRASAYIVQDQHNGDLVAVLGEASATGFDLGFNPLSRTGLTTLMQHITQSHKSLPERLVSAFYQAHTQVQLDYGHYPEVVSWWTALGIYVVNYQAWIAWVGDQEALLVRDNTIVAKTTGHKRRRSGPEQRVSDIRLHLPSRQMRTDEADSAVPEHLPRPWHLLPGDMVIIATQSLIERAPPFQAIAYDSHDLLQQASDHLIQTAMTQMPNTAMAMVAIWVIT